MCFSEMLIKIWTGILEFMERVTRRRTRPMPDDRESDSDSLDDSGIRPFRSAEDEGGEPLPAASHEPISEEEFEEYVHRWDRSGSAVA